MNEIFYLEPDEEITSVIDRLKNSNHDGVSLVIPRGATIAQSIVNLKLLKKSADDLKKEISLVANDRISRNLASQIGITVYSKVSEAEKATPTLAKKEEGVVAKEPEATGDFKVNSYYGKKDEEEVDSEDEEEELEEDFDDQEDSSESENDEKEDADSKVVDVKPKLSPEEEHDQDIALAREEAKKELLEKKREAQTVRVAVKDENPEVKEEESTEEEEESEPVKFERKEAGGEVKNPKKTKVSGSRKPILIISGITLLLLLIVSYFFLPYATASVQIKANDLKLTNKVVVDKNAHAVDEQNMVIPGTTVEVQKNITKSYQSTGKKSVGDKATGKATIYNDYDSVSHTIPAGTKFTSGGKSFVSDSSVTVPGLSNLRKVNGNFVWDSGTVSVSLTAVDSGEDYNIAAGIFVIAGMPNLNDSSRIYAKSTAAMSGGTTKNINYVTDNDLGNAAKDIKKDVIANNKDELKASASGASITIFDETISSQVTSEQASKKANDEADSFDYTIAVRIYALGYTNADLTQLMNDTAKQSIGDDKMLISPDKAEITAELGDTKSNTETSISIKANYSGKVGQKISADDIKNKIKNKKFSVAQSEILGIDSVQSVDLKVWPSDIFRVPFLTSRINVKFDYGQ